MNNFWKRFITTIVFLSLLTGSVCFPFTYSVWIFTFLCCLLTYGTAYELTKMLDGFEHRDFTAHLSAVACVFISASSILMKYYERLEIIQYTTNTAMEKFSVIMSHVVPWVIAFICWMAILASCNNKRRLTLLLNTVLSVFLVTMSIRCIVDIFFFGREEAVKCGGTHFNFIFLYFILITKLGDMGAYAIGTLSNKIKHGGNHKLIPSVSPGKSWEGAIGGLLTCMIGSVVLVAVFRGEHYAEIIQNQALLYTCVAFLGVMFYFGGAVGDLAESSIKRTCKVKDSGHFLPGIGGLFDLTDSLMVNALIFLLVKEPLFQIFMVQ